MLGPVSSLDEKAHFHNASNKPLPEAEVPIAYHGGSLTERKNAVCVF